MPVGRPGGGTKTRKGMFGGKGFGFDKPKPPPKPPPKKPKKPAPRTQSDVQTSGGGGYNAPPSAPLKPAPRTRSDVQTSGPDPYKPQYTRPKEPPDPQLAKHGINRSVFDFNDMLETTYNHFVGAYGRNPSPGLLFDIMRSPVGPDQVEHLFQVPDSTEHANAVGHQRKAREQDPQAYFVRRPDGHMDLPDPLDHLIGSGQAEGLNKPGFLQQAAGDIASGFTSGPIGGIIGALGDLGYYGKAGITQPGRVPTRAEIARAATPAQKKFPMVSQASLPFPGAEDFWKAITTVYETKLTDEEAKVVRRGKTLSDLEYHLQQAEMDPMVKKYARQRSGVQTVRSGQEALQKMAPEFFKNLAVDGYFTSDWAKALKIYKASARGGQQQVEFDAKEAGMSVHDYVKAWKNKQRLLKENPMYYHNIATMDLKLLVHPSSFKGSAGDLANYIVGGFHWTSPAWYIGLPFHAEAQAAKLAFSQIGASVDQFKAYGTAMRTVLEMQAKHFNSHSKTEADMKAQVRKALTEHPTWAKVFGLEMPNWADNLTNIGFDMIVLGPAKITGEFVPLGNIARASKSRYLNSASDLAWREAKKFGENGVARAAHFLESESSLTPERFLNATAKDIASGKLTKSEFQDLSAHLYAHGWVEYDGKVIGGGGGILHTLSTRQLTPKNLVFQSNKARIRNVMDRADQALRGEDIAARGNAASTFLNTVRNLWSHVAPEGQTRHFYEHRLPQRIFDYSKSRFKNPQLGEKWRNDFARARARDDIPGMQKVFDEIAAHDRKIYPSGRGPGKEPFDALFLTEAPSRAYFPTGGRKEVENMWDVLDGGAKSVNDFLLKVSGWHRRTIVSGAPIPGIAIPPGGFVLAQKHSVADTMRRIIGGGGVPVLKFEKNAYKEIEAFAHEPGNEALLRRLKFTEMRTKQGETRYMIGPSKTDPATFDTAESFHSARHMKAAGGYVRNIFNDDAITALSQSKPDDLRPLTNFLSRNKDYRGISFSRAGLPAEFKAGGPKLAKSRIQQEQALQDQAEAMWHRYSEIVDGARAQGIDDPVQAIRTMIHSHSGAKIDQALGKWIADNKVEFKVRSGLVEGRGAPLDGWTESYIGFLMTPNKLNRAGMFKHVMAKSYKAAREAGWSKADALEFGMAISERQTVKHMLDFSNMLKVEQDLRWASYFATKHRLYWNWVQNTIWRRPGLDAVANDFQEVLDDRGNLNFKVFGHKMAIPVPRILWLNSTELPDVSTPFMLAQGMVEGLSKGKNPLLYAYNHASETSGNIVTRDDQAWIAAYNLLQVARGKIHTAKGAAGMMGPKQKAVFFKEVNQFQTDYRQQHGHYAPEAEAVKVALAHTLFHEGMRANFAIPTLPTGQSEKEYTANQKLWSRYSKLTSGTKRYKFLQDHPALAAQIGQRKDPEVYRHNQEFFGRFRTLSDNRNQAREDIYQKALYEGWTPKLEAEWRKVGREYGVAVHNLELEDAEKWNGSESYPKGMIQEGQVVRPGPWGYAMQGNPFLARKQLHNLFPNIKPEELKAHTVGQTIEVLQAERTFLNTKAGKKTYADPQALRDRLAEISKQLAHFQGYPKTAAEKFHARYFDQVNAYRDKRDAWRDRISALPADKQDRAYEELRAWEDSQDKQLEVHVGGKTIKFPSPVRVGFELATPDEQRATVVRWASDNWDHLSTFAKHHLTGKHIPAAVSQGQLVYQLLISATKADQHAKKRLEAEYNIRVPMLAPGESLDKDQRTAIARQVDQIVGANGAFMKDYNFAHKPTVTRMKAYEAFNKDPQWTDLFNQVDYFLNQAKKAGYTGGERVITDIYRRQIVPQLKARVATEGSRFRHEVGFFVKQNPNFWNSLISP